MEDIELKVCYTCLNFNEHLIDLDYCDGEDKIPYYNKLSCLIASELVKQELMAICTDCMRDLKVAYRFQKTVADSQSTLKKYYECKTETVENFPVHETSENSDGNIYIEVSPDKTQMTVNGMLDFADNGHDYLCSQQDIKQERDDEFFCERCSGNFTSEKKLERHCCYKEVKEVKAESSDDETKLKAKTKKKQHKVSYQCGFCDVIFEKRWMLRKHIVRIHEIHKNHICKYCGRGFKQSYHLKEHLTVHTGEKNFSCEVCEKKFQRASSVSRHMKSHAKPPGQKSKRTPFLCNICGKSFPFSNGVQRHLRMHFGIRRHECEVCHRRFTQSTHLRVHMRTHTGEKPYVCDVCGETFSLKATMQKHISSAHENEASLLLFVCEICKEPFSEEEALQAHVSQLHAFVIEDDNCQIIDDEISDFY